MAFSTNVQMSIYIWDKTGPRIAQEWTNGNLWKTAFKKFESNQTIPLVKVVFHKFYLIHSWILCPIYGSGEPKLISVSFCWRYFCVISTWTSKEIFWNVSLISLIMYTFMMSSNLVVSLSISNSMILYLDQSNIYF